MKKKRLNSSELIEMCKDFCWIINVIDSCDKVMQLSSCYKLIDLYSDKYKFLGLSYEDIYPTKSNLNERVYYRMRALLDNI